MTRKNDHVRAQFKEVKDRNRRRGAVCIHCQADGAWNTSTWCQRHLNNYEKYQDWRKRNTLPLAKEKQTRVRDFFKSDETDEECFAVALFTPTIGFSQLDTPEWRRFFKRLGFELPNRQKSSTILLNNAYNSIKEKVQAVADSSK
ncbi:hypothetical protein K3495_g11433 [Podosphaera aphanis]|nr:hypothetical protein K3495_g11433 [Podosphaera aphanis]